MLANFQLTSVATRAREELARAGNRKRAGFRWHSMIRGGKLAEFLYGGRSTGPDTENWIGCWTKCEFPHEIAASMRSPAVASERETSYRYTEQEKARERERERESGSVTRIFPILVKKYFIRRGEEHDAVSDGTALLQSAFWILIPLQRRLHIYVFDRLISFIWHFIDTTLQNYRSKDLFAVIIQFLDSTLWRDGWQHFFCQWDSS